MNLNKKNYNQIKKKIKTNKNIKSSLYKGKCYLVVTKISILFESTIDEQEMLNLENELINNIEEIQKWGEIFELASKYFKEPFKNCEWNSFGKFVYFVWNQHKFHKKNKTIYTKENFNELNELKSNEYNIWMNSMYDTKNHEFNAYVRKVLKSI